jgi:hypothetical protein
MSGTYLYLLGPESITAAAVLIDSFRSSRTAFEDFLETHWEDVRYPYESFLEDSESEATSHDEIYYLAHALLNRIEISSTFMDVELDQFFLDCEWLPTPVSGSDGESEAQKLYQARDAARGFRIGTPRSGRVSFKIDSPRDGRRLRGCTRLPDGFARDVILLDRLCNREKQERLPPSGRYPLWVIAGWANYEGHATGAQLASLSSPDAPGFLASFSAALHARPDDSRWQIAVMERFLDVKERSLALGSDSLCVAVSSV